MKVLKIKEFKCYQPVRILNDYVTNFLHGDKHKIVSSKNEAFYLPDQGVICLKNIENKSERFIPLSNVQDFTLMDELLKKNEEVKEESEVPVVAPKSKKVKNG